MPASRLPRRSVMGAAHWAASPEPAGESGLALARTERARCQRPPRMGCVEALAGGPLSRLAATALPKGEPSLASPFGGRWCPVGTVQRLVSAAASVGDGRSPLGCITRAGRRECPRRGRRGQPASAPHTSVSPRRRLYQRAVHALGGVTGERGENLRGIEDAIKKPPARVSYGK